MLNLSQASIIEKNKIATDGVWLMLLDVDIPHGETLHLVNNTEDIVFNGVIYTAFAFSLEDIVEDGKQLPNIRLQVANVTGTIQQYLEQYDGLGGAIVRIIVINTNVPNVAEVEEHFVIVASSADNQWCSFTLGTDFTFTKRYPPIRIMKDYCPFRFKGPECGYNGSEGTCNKTLKRCRELNNSKRFGGEPTIPQGGIYASNN